MRIEITGPIGVGKTTLAHLLARRSGWRVATETPERNPFWARAYGGDRNYQFEKDVSFLLVHGVDVREGQAQADVLVCDFSFTQDLVYAGLGQTADELQVYRGIHRHVFEQCGPPDLIINLRAETPTLLDRIASRGREAERGVSAGFLDTLTRGLDGALAELPKLVPVLQVRTDALDRDQVHRNVLQGAAPLIEALAA